MHQQFRLEHSSVPYRTRGTDDGFLSRVLYFVVVLSAREIVLDDFVCLDVAVPESETLPFLDDRPDIECLLAFIVRFQIGRYWLVLVRLAVP